MVTSKLPFGSPEDLVAEGVARGTLVVARWTDRIVAAVDGVTRPDTIIDRLMLALAGMPDADLAEVVSETVLRSAMLGSLDSDYESQTNVRVAPARFDRVSVNPLTGKEFTLRTFHEALADFERRAPVTKDVWLRMKRQERGRAFTVAGLAKLDMVDTVRTELGRSLTEGAALRDFGKRLRARFEERGWSELNPSRVETVFRTNVMGSYARGRQAQMSSPLMLKLRPFWQVFTVADARRRETHGAMHGKAIAATDPFWQRAPLPWGFQCRCRCVARSEDWVRKNGITVVDGSSVSGLPDPGFEPHGVMPAQAVPPQPQQQEPPPAPRAPERPMPRPVYEPEPQRRPEAPPPAAPVWWPSQEPAREPATPPRPQRAPKAPPPQPDRRSPASGAQPSVSYADVGDAMVEAEDRAASGDLTRAEWEAVHAMLISLPPSPFRDRQMAELVRIGLESGVITHDYLPTPER